MRTWLQQQKSRMLTTPSCGIRCAALHNPAACTGISAKLHQQYLQCPHITGSSLFCHVCCTGIHEIVLAPQGADCSASLLCQSRACCCPTAVTTHDCISKHSRRFYLGLQVRVAALRHPWHCLDVVGACSRGGVPCRVCTEGGHHHHAHL